MSQALQRSHPQFGAKFCEKRYHCFTMAASAIVILAGLAAMASSSSHQLGVSPSGEPVLGAPSAFGNNAGATCSASTAGRDDCYPWTTTNLTASKCLAHGCCWDPTTTVEGVPWCFYPTIPAPAPLQCAAVTIASRLDCHPEENASEDSCGARGCCWDTSAAVTGSAVKGIPACFYPRTTGLVLQSSKQTVTGTEDTLAWGDARRGPFGNDPATVVAEISYETDTRLRLRVTNPADRDQWDVTPLVRAAPAATSKASNPLYAAATPSSAGSQWAMQVVRTASGAVLFNSTPASQFGGMIFERQYIEFSTAIPPGARLFGLGEHVTPLELDATSTDEAGQTYTIFARDRGTPDHAAHGGTNLYGHHPILYITDPSTGEASGIVLVNSNAMDVVIQPGAVTFRVIGGIIDLYVLAGPTPLAVSQQYAELVGHPGMPPYWALGFHLCRWGYYNASYFGSIVSGMEANNMPIDAYWHDIDLFNEHRDFTVDPVNYPQSQMGPIISHITGGGVHYGGIIDPGIQCNLEPGQYPALDNGTAADVWIRNGTGDGYVVRAVWPGPTYFPDFFAKNTQQWWTQQYAAFRANFQGAQFAWLDMNEIATIADTDTCGPARPNDRPRSAPLRVRVSESAEALALRSTAAPAMGDGFDPEWPPYLPGRFGGNVKLETKTLPMDSQQSIGLNYNTHSLYGWSESRATTRTFQTLLGERPLIISRSTFLGHSALGAGHWLGDNTATWHDLHMNIAGVLQFGALFQVPLVGADTCGFNNPTNAELCTRWMATSAMLAPFFRNHNSINMPEQAPYVFGEPYTSSIRAHMFERVRLLPMWATAFFRAASDAIPPVRPLFMEFPSSALAGADVSAVDDEAVVGPGLLVAPVITQGADSRSVFVPRASVWYDWWTGNDAATMGVPHGAGVNVTVPCPLDSGLAPVFLRGGTVIPTQTPARNSTAARSNPLQYTAAIDVGTGSATGELFWDDGVAIDSVAQGKYVLVAVNATHNASSGSGGLVAKPAVAGMAPPATAAIDTVVVFGAVGASATATTATANGSPATVAFDATTGVLSVALPSPVGITDALNVQWTTRVSSLA